MTVSKWSLAAASFVLAAGGFFLAGAEGRARGHDDGNANANAGTASDVNKPAAAATAPEQSPGPEPLHIAAGTVLTFHLQTRFNPENKNKIDLLPTGTALQVKMLDTVD